jgi:hypothetical protein
VFSRITLIASLTVTLLMACAGSASANPASFDPPVAGAELVSRDTASAAESIQSALATIEHIDLNTDSAVVTVDDIDGPHDITLDYGDLMTDKRTAGAGYFAGAYLGLGVLSRARRLLKGLFGPLSA